MFSYHTFDFSAKKNFGTLNPPHENFLRTPLVASAREWDFTAQQLWWSWVFAHLVGNIADDAMQMDVQNMVYPCYTTKKLPVLR